MNISNKIVVQNILKACLNNRIEHVVFSPGSRNAPFALTFDAHPEIKTHVIHDERAAGFFALGVSQTIQKPVVLCCTSGSALLNYFPAISEAFYREIPLIVISADRPKRLINKGHGQTIMQTEVYGQHVKKSLSIEDMESIDRQDEIFEIFSTASLVPLGPTHLNVHLEEPLYGSEYVNIIGQEKQQFANAEDQNLISTEVLESLAGAKTAKNRDIDLRRVTSLLRVHRENRQALQPYAVYIKRQWHLFQNCRASGLYRRLLSMPQAAITDQGKILPLRALAGLQRHPCPIFR